MAQRNSMNEDGTVLLESSGGMIGASESEVLKRNLIDPARGLSRESLKEIYE